MFICDVLCNQESSHAYHRQFLPHTQKHVYAHLFETTRFPDHWYCIFVFSHLLGFLLVPKVGQFQHLQHLLMLAADYHLFL